MELSILKKVEKPLLSRTEVYAEVIFTGKTPSRQEVSSKLADSLKASKDTLVIKKISQIYGSQKANILAYMYKDIDSLKQFELVKKEKKEKPSESPAKDEKEGRKEKIDKKKEETKEKKEEKKEKSAQEKGKEQKGGKEEHSGQKGGKEEHSGQKGGNEEQSEQRVEKEEKVKKA